MEFENGTDLLTARQLVSERMATVIPTLPTWAAPPLMLQPLSSTSRVMKIGLSSDTRSLIEMSMISYWNIRAHLLRVPGGQRRIWGERLQMLQVQVDPAKLAANKVTLETVMSSTSDALDAGLLQYSPGALIGTGGSLETPSQTMASGTSSPSPRRRNSRRWLWRTVKASLRCSWPTSPTWWKTTSS